METGSELEAESEEVDDQYSDNNDSATPDTSAPFSSRYAEMKRLMDDPTTAFTHKLYYQNAKEVGFRFLTHAVTYRYLFLLRTKRLQSTRYSL